MTTSNPKESTNAAKLKHYNTHQPAKEQSNSINISMIWAHMLCMISRMN